MKTPRVSSELLDKSLFLATVSTFQQTLLSGDKVSQYEVSVL